MGSPGGSGGPGAQGAGGSSYSVYYVGVMPELADVTYSQGKPGSGSVPGGVSNVGYP